MFFFFVKYDKKIVFHYHFSLDITPLDLFPTFNFRMPADVTTFLFVNDSADTKNLPRNVARLV